MNDNEIRWISKWYHANCDGDWEHDFGIVIETIDNPGWSITIDTKNTSLVLPNKPWVLKEKNVNDWYGFEILDGQFRASGDPMKLEFLISLFREMVTTPNDIFTSDSQAENEKAP